MTDLQRNRRLSAIVMADVVGYSLMMNEDEIATLEVIKDIQTDLINPLVNQHGGRIVKTMGDGFLIEFASVVEATQCSIEIQKSVFKLNGEDQSKKNINLRFGIHLGDIIETENDIYGDGVNIAARLESHSTPGGICISSAVHDQINGKIDYSFQEFGNLNLKNIKHPVKAYTLDSDAIEAKLNDIKQTYGLFNPKSIDVSAAERPSIIIMPFKNLSGDDSEGIADGIRLTLHSTLIKLPGLFLIHTGTVEKYRGKAPSSEEVRKEISTKYIIDGSIQKIGNQIRITIEVTDTERDQIILSERYDRIIHDIFSLQDEIAFEITKTLGVEFFGLDNGSDQISTKISAPEAQENFLVGLSHFYKGTQQDNSMARSLFQKVLDIEPEVGRVYGLIGLTYWRDGKLGWSEDKEQQFEKVREYAELAVQNNDPDGIGNILMGNLYLHNKEHKEALEASKIAMDKRPSCPLANALSAEIHQYIGKPEEAVTYLKHSISLAKSFPPWMLNILASSLRDKGDINTSIDAANEAVRLNYGSNKIDALVTLCCNYTGLNMMSSAKSVAETISSIDIRFSVKDYLGNLPYTDKDKLKNIRNALLTAGLTE